MHKRKLAMEKRFANWLRYDENGFFIGEELVELIEDNYQERTVIGRKGKHKGKEKQVLGDLESVTCLTMGHEPDVEVIPIEHLKFGVNYS